jgi:hypothetical protein
MSAKHVAQRGDAVLVGFEAPRVRQFHRRARQGGRRGFIAHFIAHLLPLAISPIEQRPVSVLARPSVGPRWGIPKFPTRLDCRGDDFLCGTGTSERFDNFGEQGGECHRRFPTYPHGRPERRSQLNHRKSSLKSF